MGRGGVELFDISVEKLNRIIEINRKYQDIPMDLADASLVAVSEETGIREILTIESDYYIYRTITKEMIRNVLDH
ncbi:MAG: toxin-antitoxin system, toxin component, PIN family protein [Spirochaetes bacterium]|nr:toxin-antitoxin system, toxin component, PIN family protein [Spirochaetota bacterium]